jgi:RimJ/RimL family protein N-acetyltransferase
VPTRDDAAAVYAYASDPEVTRFMAFATHASIADAQAFLANAAAAWETGVGHLPWLIERGTVIGAMGADREGHVVNVGYILARHVWGQGYGTEALAAVCDAAFADPRVMRVQAYHDVDNPASGRIMEKAGMLREGLLRAYSVHPQQGPRPRDCWMWAKVR